MKTADKMLKKLGYELYSDDSKLTKHYKIVYKQKVVFNRYKKIIFYEDCFFVQLYEDDKFIGAGSINYEELIAINKKIKEMRKVYESRDTI